MIGSAPAQQKVCPACNTRYAHADGFCARDGTPLLPVPETGRTSDLVGQVLAERYRLVRCIGEGGMGQVYEAQHVNINRRFAIKLLRPEIVSNPEAVARFHQEAWSASSIGHENIIEIDDFATLPNGSVYLAMEFLEGMSLAERMRKPERLFMAEMLDVLLQTCRGLEAAHQKNIVHRDMKPENIFLVERNERLRAKILDFGIAKVSGTESSQHLTRTGTIFGTPFYMSPEQALGKPLDLRADIYSVGVIMYELFTGRVPFEAESFMGILTKHVTTMPQSPRQLAPDREIPEMIERIILRAMAKELEQRYATMAELLQDLEEVASQLSPDVLVSLPRTSPGFGRVSSGPSGSFRSEKSGVLVASDPKRPRASKRGLAVAVAALLGMGGAATVMWKRAAVQPAVALPVAPVGAALPPITSATPLLAAPTGPPVAPTRSPVAPTRSPAASTVPVVQHPAAPTPAASESAPPLPELYEPPKRTDVKHAASKRPAKTPVAKTATPKTAAKPTAGKKEKPAIVDPYERLDDKKGGKLIDPY